MTVRGELHSLVDRLGDDRAREVLAFLRRLVREDEAANGRSDTSLLKQMEPPTVSGRAFFSQPAMSLETLAVEQGVRPVADFDALLGDFWPEDETADAFIAAVRQWRREGGSA